MPRSPFEKPVPGRLFVWVKRISWVELAIFTGLIVFWLLPEGIDLTYIGRPGRASPGEGYAAAHALEQERIALTALTPGV